MSFSVILIDPEGDIHSTGVLTRTATREPLSKYFRDMLKQKLQDRYPNSSADALIDCGWKLIAVERLSGRTHILSIEPTNVIPYSLDFN